MHRQPVRLLLPRCINVLKHLTSINASACWHNCRYLFGKCEFPMILYPFSTILLARKVACQREIPLISSFIATLPLSLSLSRFSLFPDLRSNIISSRSSRDLCKIFIRSFLSSVLFSLLFIFLVYYFFYSRVTDSGFEVSNDWNCCTYRES